MFLVLNKIILNKKFQFANIRTFFYASFAKKCIHIVFMFEFIYTYVKKCTPCGVFPPFLAVDSHKLFSVRWTQLFYQNWTFGRIRAASCHKKIVFQP